MGEVRLELGQHVARLRPRDGELRPLLGDRRDENAILGPLGLQPFLEPGGDAVGAARGGVQEGVIVGEPHRDAVIGKEAQLVHHQPVAAVADFQRREHVGVHAVEEFRRVRPLDLDLAERRGFEQADLVSYTEDFAVDRGVLVFAGPG